MSDGRVLELLEQLQSAVNNLSTRFDIIEKNYKTMAEVLKKQTEEFYERPVSGGMDQRPISGGSDERPISGGDFKFEERPLSASTDASERTYEQLKNFFASCLIKTFGYFTEENPHAVVDLSVLTTFSSITYSKVFPQLTVPYNDVNKYLETNENTREKMESFVALFNDPRSNLPQKYESAGLIFEWMDRIHGLKSIQGSTGFPPTEEMN